MTPIGYWLGHNTAWEGYFSGFNDGLDEGVNRALGISAKQAVEIEQFLIEARIFQGVETKPIRPTTQSGDRADMAISPEQTTGGLCKPIGGILAALGVMGGVMLLMKAPGLPSGLPNAVNFSLMTAFGVATYRGKRISLVLGWSYFVLLASMTVMHGFVPMEIFQCIGLIAFLVYLRRRV